MTERTHVKDRTKRTTTVAAAVVLLMAGGIAFAYWTAGGSGTGTATTGDTEALVANQTSTITDLAPGVAAQTLSGDFDNDNDGPIYVTSVVASIDSVTKAGGAPSGTCTAADYELLDATMSVGAQVPAGTSQGSWSGATLGFKNDGARNQDACKGATVTLSYVIN